MATGSLRRSNLISPFGPGSLTTLVNGTSVVVPGIDTWYLKDGKQSIPPEAILNEPRLQRHLEVTKFVLPPAGRGHDSNGTDLSIPVARFPKWSFCPYCKLLKQSSLTQTGHVKCDGCSKKRGKFDPDTSQVPFLVACADGHIADFPWNEWVHRDSRPGCEGDRLTLKSAGTGDLSGQVVRCENCESRRSLRGVTQSTVDSGAVRSTLSESLLDGDEQYLCRGSSPWLFLESGECNQHIVGVLRSASNLYFANVESAIFVPEGESLDSLLQEILESPSLRTTLNYLVAAGLDVVPAVRPDLTSAQSLNWSDDEIRLAANAIFGTPSESIVPTNRGTIDGPIDREPEWSTLRGEANHTDLVSRPPRDQSPIDRMGRRRLVPVLKETRALTGFSRLRSGTPNRDAGKSLLQRTRRFGISDWLPAYVVRGEGLYFELDKDHLQAWEKRPAVVDRASRLARRLQLSSHPPVEAEQTARFFLLHTLAHALINQMVFSSGYSSASLRERTYSGLEDTEMAGILVYTASGDSDGTLGGLVRMGETEVFLTLLRESLESSRWCANDPVCMELGESGQGVEGANGASCHSCGLLPETACEHFNRGLDRGLLIGTLENSSLGYFS